jgi:hypothetical protein
MSSITALFQSIPDIVWSGLLASAVTLGGVLVSNRSNTNRLLLQLKNDALEKSKERIATLRRDVYLLTAEELVKVNVYLGSLPQIDPSKINLSDGLQPFFAASAKMQLVAEPDTALLVNKIVGLYGELLLQLLGELSPSHSAKTDIGIHDDLYTKAQVEVARILTEMTKFNEAGQQNDTVFRSLSASFSFQQAQAYKHAKARSDAWNRFKASQLAFHRFMIPQLRAIGAQQIPMLIAIRSDLGLNTNLEAIEAQMQAQRQRMEVQLDALLTKLTAS